MSVPRAKAKKEKHKITKLTTNDVIRMTNYLNIAVVFITLYQAEIYTEKEQFKEFADGYKALLCEVGDKRMPLWNMVRWAEEITGVDISDMVVDVFGNFDIGRKNGR